MKNDQNSPGTSPGEFLTYPDRRPVPKACLVSEEAPECESLLTEIFGEGFRIFRVPEDRQIPYPVRCHPDMIFTVIGDALVVPSAYYGDHPDLIDEISARTGKEIILSRDMREARYPYDTGLNTAVGDGFIILRKSSCSPAVTELAAKLGMRVIDVNQGYAGCSCIVADSLVITSDPGIYSALASAGIRAEYVDNEGIRLPGYDRGFIGGAGGYACGRLFLFGSCGSFSGGAKLTQICRHKGITIAEIPCPGSGDVITDFGGLKFIY